MSCQDNEMDVMPPPHLRLARPQGLVDVLGCPAPANGIARGILIRRGRLSVAPGRRTVMAPRMTQDGYGCRTPPISRRRRSRRPALSTTREGSAIRLGRVVRPSNQTGIIQRATLRTRS